MTDAGEARPAAGEPLVVLGGANLIAGFLLRRLAGRRGPLTVVARRPVPVPDGAAMRVLDVLAPGSWRPPRGATVVSVLPLSVLAAVLPVLEGAGHVIALGSTSRLAKAESADGHDRALAEALGAAETALEDWCQGSGARFTIMRPTLVYDGRNDRNIARMARFVRRFRMLPIAAPGTGLRQPIHAEDVARALLGTLGNEAALDRRFDIAGSEVLTYRAMAERVFRVNGLTPRLMPLPAGLLATGFRAAAGAGLLRPGAMTATAFARMNQDLVFDVAEGLRVLGYVPRAFEPAPLP